MKIISGTLPSDVVRTVSRVFEDLRTPFSLKLTEMLVNKDWDGISVVELDPRKYTDVQLYAKDAACAGLLKKLKELPTTWDRRAAAIEKWWSGERDCYRTNERIGRYLPEHRASADSEGHVESIIALSRKIILEWLGPRPPQLAEGRFGPGSTFSDRSGRATIPDKMSSDPVLTRDAIYYLPQWLGTMWGAHQAQRGGELVYVPGNRFATVEKNAKTHRSIASEPSINVFYQLALGRQLRRRLLQSAGWDLDSAQEVHRQVARESSVTREFATLDLSNASDTVSKNLVKILLPPLWYEQLDDLRSKKTLIEGKWVVLEKFSSMGNGFTFELETIIFAALACAVTREGRPFGYRGVGRLGCDVFVFGDDIIVKNGVARPLKSVLEFFGFKLNEEKSFYGDEQFRESCGGDYFSGFPVRPYFLKELPNEPQDYVVFANGLFALTQRLAQTGILLGRRAWFSVVDQLPARVRVCRGPQSLGDLVIHDSPLTWTVRYRRDVRYIRVLRPHRTKVVWYSLFDPSVVAACAAMGLGTAGCDNKHLNGGVIPRNGLLGYKVGWIASNAS